MKEQIEAKIKEYQQILHNAVKTQIAAEGAIIALQKLLEEPKKKEG